jgi:hypothetical protein
LTISEAKALFHLGHQRSTIRNNVSTDYTAIAHSVKCFLPSIHKFEYKLLSLLLFKDFTTSPSLKLGLTNPFPVWHKLHKNEMVF